MDVTLPVGLKLRCRLRDTVGGSICRCGVYDLAVSEAIWRLLGPGETAVDVGANIGYMTAVMASRIGQKGQVHAFEPYPALNEELTANVRRWADNRVAEVCLHKTAASDTNGAATMVVPTEFAANRGISRIETDEDAQTGLTVSTTRLDKIFQYADPIGLLKIDVEGHEPAVFRGSEELLARHQIRDIIFEEHGSYPTASSHYLEGKGYQIYGLEKGLFGPVVKPPTAVSSVFRTRFDARNLIATTDSRRLLQRIRSRGYQILNIS